MNEEIKELNEEELDMVTGGVSITDLVANRTVRTEAGADIAKLAELKLAGFEYAGAAEIDAMIASGLAGANVIKSITTDSEVTKRDNNFNTVTK